MAGIGFELRKYLQSDSYLGIFQAYGYAGIIGAGPWVLSILGVMFVGILSVSLKMAPDSVISFLVSVTWLMATSLIFTGFFLLAFIRFVADRLYEENNHIILPNVLGLILLSTLLSGILSAFFLVFLFPNQSFGYRILMCFNFVTLCNMWYCVIFASGMKQYKTVFAAFTLGYLLFIGCGLSLQKFGIEGLLTALFAGHCFLLFLMLSLICKNFPASQLVRFDFLKRKKIYLRLIFIGLFYNLGIWLDKFQFWLTEGTSEVVIGPLRASIIYDLPIFLAYLSIIPGMAVFLVKIETDFVEVYDSFFQSVREGGTLQTIEALQQKMQNSVREGFAAIVKVQGVTVLLIFLLSPSIIGWLDISPRYINLLCIDVVAVAIQVILLSILNVLFYLDRLTDALKLTFLLVTSNGLFTWVTLQMDPLFYGLGFCGSMLLTSLVGMFILHQALRKLVYHTFMLQN